eukprot:3941558-Rhodomonas_salina.5
MGVGGYPADDTLLSLAWLLLPLPDHLHTPQLSTAHRVCGHSILRHSSVPHTAQEARSAIRHISTGLCVGRYNLRCPISEPDIAEGWRSTIRYAVTGHRVGR